MECETGYAVADAVGEAKGDEAGTGKRKDYDLPGWDVRREWGVQVLRKKPFYLFQWVAARCVVGDDNMVIQIHTWHMLEAGFLLIRIFYNDGQEWVLIDAFLERGVERLGRPNVDVARDIVQGSNDDGMVEI